VLRFALQPTDFFRGSVWNVLFVLLTLKALNISEHKLLGVIQNRDFRLAGLNHRLLGLRPPIPSVRHDTKLEFVFFPIRFVLLQVVPENDLVKMCIKLVCMWSLEFV
jgi:hypothetical protein